MRYVVTYTERKAIMIDAPNEVTARIRAIKVLSNGVLYPKVKGLVIKEVVRG